MGKNQYKNYWSSVAHIKKPKSYYLDVIKGVRIYDIRFICYEDEIEVGLEQILIVDVNINKRGNIDYEKFIRNFNIEYGFVLEKCDIDVGFFNRDRKEIECIIKIHTYAENIRKIRNKIRMNKIKKLIDNG